MQDTNATEIKLYSVVNIDLKLYLRFYINGKAKGKPENFGNQPSKELTEQLNFRVTKEMKEEVKAKDDPPEFCRQAIQEKLDREK
ncbi:MAG: hypothetical protein V7K92_13815 [Nostoc sp.]|uniref:hypothetical protein n=1 Tax=Nostoc sp. TaxID=1180 RepID=UPI002FF1E909